MVGSERGQAFVGLRVCGGGGLQAGDARLTGVPNRPIPTQGSGRSGRNKSLGVSGMGRDFVIALDQGTTSSRAIVVDRSGRLVAVESEELAQHYPAPGWVEHDPAEIWTSQRVAMDRALAASGLSAGEIAAVGITNQRETTLLWNRRTGEPVGRAIVWQDRRTAARCDQLRAAGHEQSIRDRTGLVLDPYFSATKLEWMLREIPGAQSAAANGELAFGTVDTWLVWRLTGGRVHATDPTNASRTLLYSLDAGRWDAELLREFGLPTGVLPEIRPSAGEFGCVEGTGWPIRGVAGDQQAALFGQAATSAGLGKNTYGTGCFLLVHSGSDRPTPPPGLLATAACAADGGPAFALEGAVFVAGAAIQWLRDGLGLIRSAADSESIAAEVPDTGGVTVVPAFTGLGAPYWDPYARGTIVGLTRGTGRAHIVRATLESIAHQVGDLVEAMSAGGTSPATLRVDGGASDNDLLMQMQADLLGIPVERAAIRETTAMGAAFLAGLGAGLWAPDDLPRLWKCDRVFLPTISADERAARRHEWARAVERARGWCAPR